ncbi:MAG: LysE family translocator [Caldithrix sp.]|nr:LysE family translocator [Caldithrix sp.]
METMATLFISGMLLGLSGALIPGPLLTFIISETLKYGFKEGAKLSFVPLISDAPIIIVAVGVIYQLAKIDYIIGSIAVLGAIFLIYLGVESLRFHPGDQNEALKDQPKSLRKGILMNFLNPNPYIFWFSIGGPIIVKAMGQGWPYPASFLIAMYVFMIGAKMMVARLVYSARNILRSRWYIFTIRTLGLALIVFAVIFFTEGISRF